MLLFLLPILIAFFWFIDNSRHWVYDPQTLQLLAQQGIRRANNAHAGQPTAEQVVEEVIQSVLTQYPATTRYTGRWLWNNAGGAMGSMTVLHCSFSEYLIIFGTPVGTEGHTGRHMAEDFFTIIYGEQWAGDVGPVSRAVYPAGEQHYLPRRTVRHYRMPDECWALEYARGNIPSMMIFGFLDMIFSTFDLATMAQTVQESAGNMMMNLLRGKL